MYEKFGLYINNVWTRAEGGATSPVLSPVSERPLGDCPAASASDTATAIDAAAAGLKAWAATAAFARADALHKVADEMIRRTDEAARMISLETGKPIAQSGRQH